MRVLLVDDEASLLSLLTQYLTRQNHQVRTAATVADALAALHDPLDAAIIDLTLPDGSGEDVGRRCAELHPRAKVIIATGYAYTAPVPTWIVVQKPFPPRELLNVLA